MDKIDRLKAQLLTSGLQQKNQPLYQVINTLIDATRSGISSINTLLTGGPSGGIQNQSFYTENNDTAVLPSSKQLLPGVNIEFIDDGVTKVVNQQIHPFLLMGG